MVEEIKALKELLDMGAITQEEYDRKKTRNPRRFVQSDSSRYGVIGSHSPAIRPNITGAPKQE